MIVCLYCRHRILYPYDSSPPFLNDAEILRPKVLMSNVKMKNITFNE